MTDADGIFNTQK
jgi:hypothetical protein